MKQVLMLLGVNGLLMGCISPTATLGSLEGDTAFSKDDADTSDTFVEDSADTENDTDQVDDTGGAEDTDTVDTGEPQDTGPTMLGVEFMRDEHLLFDGSYTLTLQTVDSSSDFTEFHGFLKVNLSWGFALRMAPFNAATRNELFNNNEIELFSGAGYLWTLRFEPNNEQLTPVVRVYRLELDGESIEACQFMEYEYGETVELSDIENGFQLVLINNGTDDFSTRIRLVTDGRAESYFALQTPTSTSGQSSQCDESSDFSPVKIHFGRQTSIVLPSNRAGTPEPIQPIRARVDDLMIFTPLMIDNLTNFEQFDLFEPTMNLDADIADENRDGVGWWNFSLQPNQSDHFEQILDESLQTMHPEANTWFMLDAVTGQTLGSEEAREHYYVGNQQQ